MKTIFAVVILEAVAFAAFLIALTDTVSVAWIAALAVIVGHVLVYLKINNVSGMVDGRMTTLLDRISLLERTIANMRQVAAVEVAGKIGVKAGLAEARAVDPPPIQ